MTWLSTWPSNGKPAYAEHDTETQAEAHATEVVRSGKAAVATYYRIDDEETTA